MPVYYPQSYPVVALSLLKCSQSREILEKIGLHTYKLAYIHDEPVFDRLFYCGFAPVALHPSE